MRVPQLLFQVTDFRAAGRAALQLAHDEPRAIDGPAITVADAEQ